jgi:hypothetical protein
MLHDLLARDLGGWHPKEIYKTAALTEQKQAAPDLLGLSPAKTSQTDPVPGPYTGS